MMHSDETSAEFCDTRPTAPKRPSSANIREAYLVHIYPSGPAMGRRYRLAKQNLIVGRVADCDICVDEESVSRHHARIEATPTGYYAVDLDSTNGTFVNDARVTTARLRDGDYLRAGNCIYRFLSGDNVETAYHEEIYRLTIVDGLTGLANKRFFLESLERELKRAARRRRPLSLILFDIDHFKAINDTRGHLAGDHTLREFAHRLQEHFHGDELLARYGGEEFALLLVETSGTEALQVAEQVRQIVEQRPFEFDGQDFPVTISLGVASAPGQEDESGTALIQQADAKLYEAKRAGRNCVVA